MTAAETPPPNQPFWAPILVVVGGGVLIIWLAAGAINKGYTKELAKDFLETPIDEVSNDPKLLSYALARGARVYASSCASCHGADKKGIPAEHTPDMTDDFWLHGGDDIDTFKMHPSDIEKTVRVGIHDLSNKDTRNFADMPPFGAAGRAGLPQEEIDELNEEQRPILTPEEIADLAEFVLKVSGQQADAASSLRGRDLYLNKAGCFDCHTYDFKGDTAIGSADLTAPRTWLYGSDRDSIIASITMGRNGVSPAFEGKLSDEDIKAVALSVLPAIAK